MACYVEWMTKFSESLVPKTLVSTVLATSIACEHADTTVLLGMRFAYAHVSGGSNGTRM